MLALLGFGMTVAVLASGWLGPSWPWIGILGVAVLGGVTAGGYTGLAYAEYARLGGTRRTEATGLGTAVMFAGVTVFPSAFGVAISMLGGYAVADAVLATLAAVAAALLCRAPERG